MTSDEVIARLGEGTLTAANDPGTGRGFAEGGPFRNGKHESIGA